MRVGAIPEGPIERLVARLNLLPRPLIETQMAFTLARLVMAAAKLGVFEVLSDGPADPQEVARRCETDSHATEKLLFALAASEYLKEDDGRYELTPMARKWLTSESPDSLADKLIFQFFEWDLLGRSEEFIRSGRPLDIHSTMDSSQWGVYQRGMRAMARPFAAEAVRRLPVPKEARDVLDIGGSHGYYSAALCRRYEGLRAVILDLPEAVEQAAPLLAKEGMGERVVHRPGNALTDDLGEDDWDVVMIVELVHHFTEEQNRALAMRVARALRPGGVYAIIDALRPRRPGDGGGVPALLEFYFALTSESGTWPPGEMASWQRDAGLEPKRTIRFRTVPGGGIQPATKPG